VSSTFLRFLLASFSTISVPCTFVSMVLTALHDEADAHRRREVEDHIHPVHELGEDRLVEHAVDRVVEEGFPLRCSTFSIDPVERLSTTWTSSPARGAPPRGGSPRTPPRR